jgi:hypothetical protein
MTAVSNILAEAFNIQNRGTNGTIAGRYLSNIHLQLSIQTDEALLGSTNIKMPHNKQPNYKIPTLKPPYPSGLQIQLL